MSRPRRTDWASFVAGLLFVALGAVFIVSDPTDWGFTAVWILPVLAVGLGIAAVARTLTRSRDRERGRGDGAEN